MALPIIPFELHADTLQHGFRNQPLTAKAKKVDRPISFKAKLIIVLMCNYNLHCQCQQLYLSNMSIKVIIGTGD